MLTRSSLFALLSLLLLADPLLAQRRAPPSKGHGSKKGRDEVDRGRGKKRRKPPSEDRGWKSRKPPIVSGFTPKSGPPGSRVVIQGRRFGPMVKVRFNGRPLRIVSRSRGEMTVLIPRKAVSDNFVIIKPGFPAVTTGYRFEVVRPPVIRRFRPPRGEVGITVRIKGHNFLSSDEVLLNGRRMRVQTIDPRRIIATVPPGAPPERSRFAAAAPSSRSHGASSSSRCRRR